MSTFIKLYTLLLCICLIGPGAAQSTFKANQAFHPGEPNSAYKVVEHEGLFYVGGSYFDDVIGIWTAFYSVYNSEGILIDFRTERKDTMSANSISSKIMKNSSGLYYLGSYLGNSKLNHYNFALDSSWISHEVNARANNFIPHDATYSLSLIHI